MKTPNNQQVPMYEGDLPYDLPTGIKLPGEDGRENSLLPYYRDWLMAEARAQRIFSFTCTLPIVGLLSTPDFARGYLEEKYPEYTPAQRDGVIDLRIARQYHLRDSEQAHAVGKRILNWAADTEPRLARHMVNLRNAGIVDLITDDHTRYFGSLMWQNIVYAEGPDKTPLAIHAEKTGGVAPVVLKPGDIGFDHTLWAIRSLFDDNLIPFQSTERPEAGSVFFSRAELRAFIAGVKDNEFDYLLKRNDKE